jgi:hypothetical protein
MKQQLGKSVMLARNTCAAIIAVCVVFCAFHIVSNESKLLDVP